MATQKEKWGMSLQGVPCKDRLLKHCDPKLTACEPYVVGQGPNAGKRKCRSKGKEE